jgi:RNA polymerase sigma factor (sigma-70 family)
VRYVIAPILRDPQAREERLSEATMRVWEKIDAFQEERGSWNGWLTSLTRHAALNHARRISRHGRAEALSEDPPSPELTPEDVLLHQERQTALQAALGQLSAGERLLFY